MVWSTFNKHKTNSWPVEVFQGDQGNYHTKQKQKCDLVCLIKKKRIRKKDKNSLSYWTRKNTLYILEKRSILTKNYLVHFVNGTKLQLEIIKPYAAMVWGFIKRKWTNTSKTSKHWRPCYKLHLMRREHHTSTTSVFGRLNKTKRITKHISPSTPLLLMCMCSQKTNV